MASHRLGPGGLAGAAVPYAAVLLGLYLAGNAWAAIAAYHAGMVGFLLASRGAHSPRRLVQGWNGVAILVAGMVTPLAGVLIFLLWPIMALDGLELGHALEGYGLAGRSWYAFVAYYCLVNPWLEELYWRGLRGAETTRPVRDDLLFAGYHGVVLLLFVEWPWALLSVAVLTGAAWAWRRLATSFGGLAVPVATHLIGDVGIMVAVQLIAF